MCGLCGIAFGEPGRPVDASLLRRMNAPLASRGPDAEGYWIGPGVGFGHRRLSVIDLEGGAQPMVLEGSGGGDASLAIAYNGEAYNFPDLREGLESDGERFRTRSDTEVLLRGVRRHGIGFVERVVGMFAFALWDGRDGSLWLVRDRLGVKPLYVAPLPDGGVAFGSELESLRVSELVPQALDPGAVARFVAHGYVVGRESILRGVERVPPATVVRWRRGTGVSTRRYWDLADAWRARADRPTEDGAEAAKTVEAFDARFDAAVRQRLIADVPLGAFLSGGVDSNTVAGVMKRHAAALRTFTIGFPVASYDESERARACADALGSEHHARVEAVDSPELLLEVAARLDEPFADTSILPTYALSRLAREHVTVALSGDGGDELLAGYATHRADDLYRTLLRVPRAAVALARAAVDRLPDSRHKSSRKARLAQFLAAHPMPARDAHTWWRILARDDVREGVLAPELRGRLDAPYAPFRDAWDEGDGLSTLDRFLYVDYKTWLVDDILTKVDRASMSFGLEVRSPFLDHRLVEWSGGLAASWKRVGRDGKRLLRRYAEGVAPAPALEAPKTGFKAPVAYWLEGAWREVAEEALSVEAVEGTGVLDGRAVRRLFDDHVARRRDHGFFLFAILMLVLWTRRLGAARAAP